MLAAPPNTSPVERDFSQLEMVATKRRNHLNPENQKTLSLLAALKIPIKSTDCYQNEIKILKQ